MESIHGMLDKKDWEMITDAWAEHDFANGAVQGGKYPGLVAARYGKISNLADFVRKAQLMNYEAYRSMYEGRNAVLFHPTTAIITWMSHPAQPSFVWQLYHYDYEPNSSLFAVQSAAEPQHIQLNEGIGPNAGQVQVINNLPDALDSLADKKSDAVVNSVGALQYLISKHYASSEEMPQGLLAPAYMAIALPERSPLKRPIDEALVNITSDPEWISMEERFFGK